MQQIGSDLLPWAVGRGPPWRSGEAVECATLEWVNWFNNRRLLEPVGNVPPADANHRAMLDDFIARRRNLGPTS